VVSEDGEGVKQYEPVDAGAAKDPELANTPAVSLWATQETALREAMGQTASVLSLVIDPSRKLLSMALDENKELRSRIRELETGYYESIRAREASLNEASERELSRRVIERQEDRKDQLLGLVKAAAPELLVGFMQQRESAKFFASITREQASSIRELFGSAIGRELLSPVQCETLLALLPEGGDSKAKEDSDGKADC
jgi:hypothetical protein